MSNALQPGIDEARLDGITRIPLPGSRRIYATGTLYPFLRVPMREIHQAPTQVPGASKAATISTPPLIAYDSSGPYTNPGVTIDLRKGLAPLRDTWIRARGDLDALTAGSKLSRGDGVRFPAWDGCGVGTRQGP
jgi:phosphomethylpyrimidine synthase